MGILESIRQYVAGLLTGPTLGPVGRLARNLVELLRLCFRRMHMHNAAAMSAALAFQTIFTLVPTLVLALAIVAAVGRTQENQAHLRRVLQEMGLTSIMIERADVGGRPAPARPERPYPAPATGPARAARPATQSATAAATQPTTATTEVHPVEPPYARLAPRIDEGPVSLATIIEQQVARLQERLTLGLIGPIGLAAMIWATITLLTTMEHSLNRIFGAPRSRKLGRRVLLYWSAVTLGPLALMIASYLGGLLAEAVRGQPVLMWVFGPITVLGPIVIGIILLAALYKLMPNTSVNLWPALAGAMLAVPLWRLSMWAFQLYVEKVAPYSIYGALGLLPLFLVWINHSWWLFLFGAEFAHTGWHLEQLETAEMAHRTVVGPADLLAVAVAVAHAFGRGQEPVSLATLTEKLRLPPESIERMLRTLKARHVVAPTESAAGGSCWLLARPAEAIRLAEIVELVPTVPSPAAAEHYDPQLADALARVNHRAGEALGDMKLSDTL